MNFIAIYIKYKFIYLLHLIKGNIYMTSVLIIIAIYIKLIYHEYFIRHSHLYKINFYYGHSNTAHT